MRNDDGRSDPVDHLWCEFDDAVATLIGTNLGMQGQEVVMVTGEGGKGRTEEGINQFKKNSRDMHRIWQDLIAVDKRAKTRIYRMGYNRALRLFALRK